eukprot:10659178-Alexandrium_andersonii.AAC.1
MQHAACKQCELRVAGQRGGPHREGAGSSGTGARLGQGCCMPRRRGTLGRTQQVVELQPSITSGDRSSELRDAIDLPRPRIWKIPFEKMLQRALPRKIGIPHVLAAPMGEEQVAFYHPPEQARVVSQPRLQHLATVQHAARPPDPLSPF